ncbi:MAG: RagB/SusD family nutrient uptake outer membrane protein [Odoribacteraceae bacterium]|jgi:hypothetical protein|nr:RagB/SusD family nutrient uptake outer membrane protein [Odoribacteraceae bacterium]
MKKIFSITSLCCLLLAGGGCEKFLEESSQNEVRPSTVADLEQLMTGEVYPIGTTMHNYLELLTDNVESNFYNSSMVPAFLQRWESVFTWQAEMYELLDAIGASGNPGVRIDSYEHYYTRIKGCNVILDMLDAVRGEEGDKANLCGQALGMRAWFYFMLVNLYGQPYNAPGVDPGTTPGVPLILLSGVKDELPRRAPVAEVYRQVEADLLEALPLLEAHGQGNSKYKVTDMFICTLLSRLYLYKEEWEEVERYASLGLAKNAQLSNLADYIAGAAVGTFSDGVYGLGSPEAIWYGYGTNNEHVSFDWTGFYRFATYVASTGLKTLYEYQNDPDNRMDMRYRYYYMWEATITTYPSAALTVGTKRSALATSASGSVKGMRVAELYLNRAEANARRFLLGGDDTRRTAALADLNQLRRHRYDTRNVAYQPVNITDAAALLAFCLDERRRELNFEDHRWFDLRRLGMPRLEHTIQVDAEQAPQTYVLEQGGLRYVLPIPRYVLDKNPALVPNP